LGRPLRVVAAWLVVGVVSADLKTLLKGVELAEPKNCPR
jgi:hypothetical protein